VRRAPRSSTAGIRVTLLAVMRVVIILLALAAPAAAHPLPLSILDVHVGGAGVEATLTVHSFDLREREPAALFAGLTITADGRPLAAWSAPELDREHQTVRVRRSDPVPATVLRIDGVLFPGDPTHQTFVNIYEDGALQRQAILGRRGLEHHLRTGDTRLGVIRRFGGAGVAHILGGVDHLLFLVGLLLLGGSLRRLAVIASAFTLGHSLTLSLAALALVQPPARLIEPAIALTIVCVGADNLMARGRRDLRPLFAAAFGLIHGFGFAGALRDMGLPRGALAWSLAAFNGGVELGQLALVLVVATSLAALRAHSEQAGRRLAMVGSVGVAAAGAFWFIQRLFFSGGIS
jgi:hypothetical protein